MAFAQYYKAGCLSFNDDTDNSNYEWAKLKALKTFKNIERRKSNPLGLYGKGYPGTRDFSGINVPMIDINICFEMKEVFNEIDIENRVKQNINYIFDNFYDEKFNLLRENAVVINKNNINNDDEDSKDTFEGVIIRNK